MTTIFSRLLLLPVFLFTVSSFASQDDYQYLKQSDGVIAYRLFGQGEPLFLLNGGPGRTSDSFTALAENLSRQGRQVIIFDQRGTGRSKLTVIDSTTVTLAKMIADLEALRKHLGFKKISVLGHSFGGMYGMSYAAKFPFRIQRLVLSASAGVDLSWQEYTNTNMLSRISEAARIEYAYWTDPEQIKKDPPKARLNALRALLPAYVYDQKFLPQIAEAVLKPEYTNFDVNGLMWQDLHKQKYNLRNSFQKKIVPTLIIACRQDILGEAVPLTIQASIPGSRLEFLNQCSHYPFVEKPEKYFQLVKDFLADNH